MRLKNKSYLGKERFQDIYFGSLWVVKIFVIKKIKILKWEETSQNKNEYVTCINYKKLMFIICNNYSWNAWITGNIRLKL